MNALSIYKPRLIRVPYRVWKKWLEYKEYGDTKNIAQISGYSEPTIRRALNKKEARLQVQQAITIFYAERAKQRFDVNKQNEQQQLALLNNNM
ncbi:MAG TPA: hypothetical protein PK772_06305 [Chitinophagaceae bacterium]|nr:hypothetical protein [Chitinophagaceae bacterium]